VKILLKNPLFIAGFLLKLALIIFASPTALTEWYLPFLTFSFQEFTIDPWSSWLEVGNDPAAFPYGYVMWLMLLPLISLFEISGIPSIYGYFSTLLIVDFLLLLTLNNLVRTNLNLLLLTYWFSPVLILASYILGFNDLIPTLFLTLSILSLQNYRLFISAIFLFLAISTKLSMVIALPFFLIYLYNKKSLKQYFPSFVKGSVLSIVVFILPFLFSDGGLLMLTTNTEIDKIYYLSLSISQNIEVYILPLLYMLILYSIWRIKRLNFNLFFTTTGLSFLMIVLMTPASPGWFVWIVPFLVFYQSSSDRIYAILVTLFSFSYAFNILLMNPLVFKLDEDLILYKVSDYFPDILSFLQTFLILLGMVISLRILREFISKNDFFRQSRKPFAIGVAGDSGSGKDTLADSIISLIGSHSVVKHSGDDYHLWDRNKPIWEVRTHLNPKANDLEGFSNDLRSLYDGKTIKARRYDHETGKLSKISSIKSNDFIISCGLHALYLDTLREIYSLQIYLNMDEGLRRHLKIIRDTEKRGHPKEDVIKAIDSRKSDSDKHIKVQSSFADLIFSIMPIKNIDIPNSPDNLNLKLLVTSRKGLDELSISRVLSGIFGLFIDVNESKNFSEVSMEIEGDISSEDLNLASKMLCPNIHEFLDIPPKWEDNTIGLMQLITLVHINQVLNKTF